MRMIYVHGTTPWADANLWYRNPTYINPGTKVGVMATTYDPWGCGWTGIHTHAFAVNGTLGVAKNTGFPYGDVPGPPYPQYNNLTWQHYFSFAH